MTTTPDPKTVREIARDCVADYIDDARDIAAHVMGHFGMGVPGDVYAWTDAVRTDLSAAVVSWPNEQPQDERDATVPDALWWPFTGGMDTCFSEHDGEYRECCWRAGLAYVLKLHEQQVRATAQDERDGDVRAVAAVRDARNGQLDDRLRALFRRFADRIAALDARDAKAGEQR